MFSTHVKFPAPYRQFLFSFFRVAACMMLLLCLPSVWAAGSTTVVISQVYGGGASASATFSADYVELLNISSTPQSLDGFAVQYISAAGVSGGTVVAKLVGVTLAPGQRYLIVAADKCNLATTPSCVTLPTPD